MKEEETLTFCSLADLNEKRKITKWVDEFKDELTAIKIDGEIIVTSTVCFHMGGEFKTDWKNKQFKCKWHDWKFDIKTGESLSYKLPGRSLQHYEFEEKDGLLIVKRPI